MRNDMNRSAQHSPPLRAEATEEVEEVGLVPQQWQQQQQQDPLGTGTFGSRNSHVPTMRIVPPSQLAPFPTAPKHGTFGPQNPHVLSEHRVHLVQLAAFPTAAEHQVFGPLTVGSAQQKMMRGPVVPVAAVFAFLGGSSSTQVSGFATADVRKEMQLWVEGAA
ncbi:unnamed protein product [Closterium sp. NIES-54]